MLLKPRMRLIQKGPKLAGFPTLDEIQSLKDAISAAPPFAKIVRQLIQKVVIGKTPAFSVTRGGAAR